MGAPTLPFVTVTLADAEDTALVEASHKMMVELFA
jgi:hypothetical protein